MTAASFRDSRSELSPSYYVVPSHGTGLSLLRNQKEPIPWDHDLDVQLQTSGEVEWCLGPQVPK